jgi:mutator protein MutT
MPEDLKSLPHKRIGVAVIFNQGGEILIDRRLKKGLMGGLWEFPGGKIEPNETVIECIKREILEELGIEIGVDDHLMTVDYTYQEFSLTLIVHNCHYLSGKPQAIECEEVRWVKREDLNLFSFPDANAQIIAKLQL